MRSLGDLIFGRFLANHEDSEQRIGPLAGIPLLGLDALSSSAYGPEAAATVLIPLGALGASYVLPISLSIIALLVIVYFSYRQTIIAYPKGGGSYTVASENLGTFCGLLAAAALLLDYVLTVAVGISAGVGALISALPGLQPYTLGLCLVTLLVITVINLRGVRESSLAFMVPTYLFIVSMLAVLVYGIYQTLAAGGHPTAVLATGGATMAATTKVAGAWLLARAFASGCTAMTGVEAVSNGVKAFREPVVRNATRTLTLIIAVLIVLLGGIAYLAQAYGLHATDPGAPGYESLLSQLLSAIVGRGSVYFVTIGAVVAVLMLSANTGFADFPRMCQIIARDNYLPHIFAERGRRLVFSYGILAMAVLAGVLLTIFGGVTDNLIPLYAIGAFLAFTLSQAGMVRHWWKLRATSGRRGQLSLIINAVGATATGVTLVVVFVSKFAEGGWVTAVLVPLNILFFYRVRRHYVRVARALTTQESLTLAPPRAPIVIVPVREWNRLASKSLKFAFDLSDDIIGVYVDQGESETRLEEQWERHVRTPARLAGRKEPAFVRIPSPYRRIFSQLITYINELAPDEPERKIAVLIPSLVEHKWHHYFLHNHRALLLQGALRLAANRRVVTILVPWYL